MRLRLLKCRLRGLLILRLRGLGRLLKSRLRGLLILRLSRLFGLLILLLWLRLRGLGRLNGLLGLSGLSPFKHVPAVEAVSGIVRDLLSAVLAKHMCSSFPGDSPE